MDLAKLEGKLVAIVLNVNGREVVVRGTASAPSTATGSDTGIVRIELDASAGPGQPVFYISQDEHAAQVEVDAKYGCDYCVNLSRPSGKSKTPAL